MDGSIGRPGGPGRGSTGSGTTGPGGIGRHAVRARNALLAIGAFYVSRWLAALLQAALSALASGTTPGDGVRQAVMTPLIGSLSHAVAAASAGVAVALLAESRSPSRWAIIPALLWFVALLDEVTISAPGVVHTVTQIIAAALPSIVCLAAAHLGDWHRAR